MANTKKLSLINDAAMGEYRIEAYDSRKYNTVFYSIRELYGKVAQRQLGEAFDWETFKQHFETNFGKAEDRKYTMEQLLAFAKDKFDYSLEKLIEYNQRSWQRHLDRHCRNCTACHRSNWRWVEHHSDIHTQPEHA